VERLTSIDGPEKKNNIVGLSNVASERRFLFYYFSFSMSRSKKGQDERRGRCVDGTDSSIPTPVVISLSQQNYALAVNLAVAEAAE
jgi:hypothetical protein